MATELQIYGPFEIAFDKSSGKVKRISKEHADEFWKEVEHKQFARKCGCYVFALGASRGFTPWYVGRSSKGFKSEIFTAHKIVYYNEVMYDKTIKGKPVMFFVAQPGTKNVVPKVELSQMEKLLIQFAYLKNPRLCNKQNTKIKPESWTIKGVIRSSQGKPSSEASKFKKMMNI